MNVQSLWWISNENWVKNSIKKKKKVNEKEVNGSQIAHSLLEGIGDK